MNEIQDNKDISKLCLQASNSENRERRLSIEKKVNKTNPDIVLKAHVVVDNIIDLAFECIKEHALLKSRNKELPVPKEIDDFLNNLIKLSYIEACKRYYKKIHRAEVKPTPFSSTSNIQSIWFNIFSKEFYEKKTNDTKVTPRDILFSVEGVILSAKHEIHKKVHVVEIKDRDSKTETQEQAIKPAKKTPESKPETSSKPQVPSTPQKSEPKHSPAGGPAAASTKPHPSQPGAHTTSQHHPATPSHYPHHVLHVDGGVPSFSATAFERAHAQEGTMTKWLKLKLLLLIVGCVFAYVCLYFLYNFIKMLLHLE